MPRIGIGTLVRISSSDAVPMLLRRRFAHVMSDWKFEQGLRVNQDVAVKVGLSVKPTVAVQAELLQEVVPDAAARFDYAYMHTHAHTNLSGALRAVEWAWAGLHRAVKEELGQDLAPTDSRVWQCCGPRGILRLYDMQKEDVTEKTFLHFKDCMRALLDAMVELGKQEDSLIGEEAETVILA